jgi:hypothetical protein
MFKVWKYCSLRDTHTQKKKKKKKKKKKALLTKNIAERNRVVHEKKKMKREMTKFL